MTLVLEQPDLDRPAGRDSRIEELTSLVTAFSEISDRLQESQLALTRRVAALQEELAAKNRLLSQQQRQLEQRNRLAALGEMAAGLAHEIRNPLGGIGLYAGLLSEDLAARPEQADACKLVDQIKSGVRRLEQTVGRVLRFAGEIVAEPRECDAASVVTETVELCRPEAERRNVKLVVKASAARSAIVDPTLLGQAVMNLVVNAIEAVGGGATGCRAPEEPPPTVKVHLARERGRLLLEVEDNGPGLPEGVEVERLFDPFFTTSQGGTGLGLSIVRRIAEAHGGRVAACNRAVGGARFTLYI